MVCLRNICKNTLQKGAKDDDDNDNNNNNNNIIIIIVYLTTNGLSPVGSGYNACT
jgi:hypothetical protein